MDRTADDSPAEGRNISISEAAAILHIHRDTAYRLVKQGKFPVPVMMLGSKMRVSYKQLIEYIDGPSRA